MAVLDKTDKNNFNPSWIMDKMRNIGYNECYVREVSERGGTMRYKKSVFRSLAMVTQLGISVMTPIFLCIFAGYYIDTHFGTKLTVLFLILGTMAGGLSGWKLVKTTMEAEQRDDERARQLKRSQTPYSSASKPKQPSRIRRDASVPQQNTKESSKTDGSKEDLYE